MLLLANAELFDQYIAKAAATYVQFDAEAYQARRESDAGEYIRIGSTAVIQITGPTTYKYDFWSYYMGGTSYQGLSAKLNAANADTAVQKIVLLFDTPGGEVTGLQEIAGQIKASDKNITAFVDPCCASAGLWMASQCSRIVGIPSAEIGSLGVQAVAGSYAERLKKDGIDVTIFRAAISPDKNLGHPYEAMSDTAREYIQERVDKKGEQFVATVAAGRGVPEAVVREQFGKGRMLDAEDAVKVGLMDGIMSLSSLLAENTTQPTPTQRRHAMVRRPRS